MLRSVGGREEALRRWEGWLVQHFPHSHIARERMHVPERSEEAVWHVEFQDGKLGRIHVTAAALMLSGDEFARLTQRLNRTDWYAHLDQFIRIRIDRAGEVEHLA